MTHNEQTILKHNLFNQLKNECFENITYKYGEPISTDTGTINGGIITETIAITDKAYQSVLPIMNYSSLVDQKNVKECTNHLLNTKHVTGKIIENEHSTFMLISNAKALKGEGLVARGDISKQTVISLNNFIDITTKNNLKKYNYE